MTMLKLVYCIARRADLTPEAFACYWRDVHGRGYLRMFRRAYREQDRRGRHRRFSYRPDRRD